MKRLLVIVALLSAGCVPTPAPKPPAPPEFCVAPNVHQGRVDGPPLAGAHVFVAGAKGDTNKDGYLYLYPIAAGATTIHVTADGFDPADVPYTVASLSCDVAIALTPTVPPLPAPPTRDEILNVRMSFQGLDVVTQQFGVLPWFEAALPWLQPVDRQAAYAAKHASKAWDGGDTHALVFLPSGPALYDEPHQPYSADRFGPLDWTNGNTKIDPKLADLIAEIAHAGFNRQLLFLGGDDGSTCGRNPVPPQCGYVIASKQLDLVADALRHSTYGDLRVYVVVIPGFDGTFYGYTPDQIHEWGAHCRRVMLYCGFEHSTGHIPAGDGPGEWAAPNGPMRSYDLILSEFDDDRFDDSVWQIAARMIGPAYRRPADQPSGDDPHPPFYPKDPTDRGPIRDCVFEFGLFGQVHGAYGADHVNTAQRPYFKNIGYTCGG